MRLAVINSRLALIDERGAIDVAAVSAGTFSPDPHAEAGLGTPESDPVVFAKFPSSITGPAAVVELPSEAVDYEAELVVVIGERAHRAARQDAWAHVAGLTLDQDLSERLVQFRGPTPQFSLGKSFPGFSPIGPLLVTHAEVSER